MIKGLEAWGDVGNKKGSNTKVPPIFYPEVLAHEVLHICITLVLVLVGLPNSWEIETQIPENDTDLDVNKV